MARKWFTSDLHFGHEKCIEYCNRPYKNAQHMNEMLIQNWNKIVHPGDEVYHLGDFAFLKNEEIDKITSRLNGKIHGIWGNHDKNRNLTNHGFVSMYQFAELQLAKDIIVKMCHFPYTGDHAEYDRFPHLRPQKNDDKWLLHGHVHNAWKIKEEEKMINVGCDVWNYTPIAADTIIEIIRKNS